MSAVRIRGCSYSEDVDVKDWPLVSVVVASYNHASYLQRRMQSLLSQSYLNLEILVIDDCSPDNSLEVLSRYEDDPRVTLIKRKRNGGWVEVSNQGIALAKGKYVLFANCDDYCEPNIIERLVAGIEQKDDIGIAFSRSILVNESDFVIGEDFVAREPAFKRRCEKSVIIAGKDMSRFLLHSCVIPNLSAALIRRDCFDNVGVFSPFYQANSDWDLFFRIADGYDFAFVSEPLNYFRQHSKTIRSRLKARVTYEEFFRLLLGEIRRLDFLNFGERCRYRMRVMTLWCHHMVSQPFVALRNFPYHFGRVLSLDPSALVLFLPAVMQQCWIVVFHRLKLIVWRK